MKNLSKNEPPVLSFKTPKQFEKWLGKNHATSNGIWLRLFKKDSGEKLITHSEALDEALCYGWIDGQADKYDDIHGYKSLRQEDQKASGQKGIRVILNVLYR